MNEQPGGLRWTFYSASHSVVQGLRKSWVGMLRDARLVDVVGRYRTGEDGDQCGLRVQRSLCRHATWVVGTLAPHVRPWELGARFGGGTDHCAPRFAQQDPLAHALDVGGSGSARAHGHKNNPQSRGGARHRRRASLPRRRPLRTVCDGRVITGDSRPSREPPTEWPPDCCM